MEPVEIVASQGSDETLDINCKVPRPCFGVLFSGRALCWHFLLHPRRLAHRVHQAGILVLLLGRNLRLRKGRGLAKGLVVEPGLGWSPDFPALEVGQPAPGHIPVSSTARPLSDGALIL